MLLALALSGESSANRVGPSLPSAPTSRADRQALPPINRTEEGPQTPAIPRTSRKVQARVQAFGRGEGCVGRSRWVECIMKGEAEHTAERALKWLIIGNDPLGAR